MDKKNLYIYYNYNALGGIESMIIRMAIFCKKMNIGFSFIGSLADNESSIQFINDLKRQGANTIILRRKKNTNFGEIIRKLYIQNNSTIITFNYFEYFQILRFIKKNNISVNLWMYIVHPSIHTISKIVFLKPLYKFILLRLYKNNAIFFMDEDCIKINEEYYNVSLKKSYNNIIRIPIDFGNDYKEKKIFDGKKMKLISVSRLDFPFKGYQIGLLKEFEQLNLEYPETSLIIVGYGSGYTKLLEEFNKLSSKVKNNITIIKGISYDKLYGLLIENDIYIGMGTTILDAIKCGLPALTVYAYTYDAFSTGYFCDHPQNIGGIEKGITYPKINIYSLLNELVHMSSKQYSILVKKCFIEAKKIYDYKLILSNILNIVNDQKYKKLDIFVFNIFCFIQISIQKYINLKKLFRK